jgi:hypothetical protein
MRAWLDALEDKSLPSLVADAEGEVAAAFTGIYRSLPGVRTVVGEKAARLPLPKYLPKRPTGAGFGR